MSIDEIENYMKRDGFNPIMDDELGLGHTVLLNGSPLYPSMVRWNPATRELNLTQEA